MKKTLKLLLLLTLVFSFVSSFNVFADPGMVGNDVIKIKKPETYTSTTSQKEYYISGVTKSGVAVSVYRYNPFTNSFHLLYVDGKAAIQTAGASGLVAQKIYLTDGNNRIRIRTDSPDGTITLLEVNITLNVLSLSDIQQSPIDIRKAIEA